MKYLLIDDSEALLKGLEIIVSGDKDVLFALCRSAQEAKEVIEKNKPDVIFGYYHLIDVESEWISVERVIRRNGIKLYPIELFLTIKMFSYFM